MGPAFEQERKKMHLKVVRRVAEVVSTVTAFVVIFSILITMSNWPAYSRILQDIIDPEAMATIGTMPESETQENPQSDAVNQPPKPIEFATEQEDRHDQPFSLENLGELYPDDMRLEVPGVFENTVPVKHVDVKDFHFEDLYTSENVIQDALREGVVQYPYTANPDQFGNVFLTGHSSYYPRDKGRYKDIFALLHKLSVGDEYFIYYKGEKYRYQVTEKFEIKPNDISVLEQPVDQKISTLMTCTPVGTTLKRLIVRGQLME